MSNESDNDILIDEKLFQSEYGIVAVFDVAIEEVLDENEEDEELAFDEGEMLSEEDEMEETLENETGEFNLFEYDEEESKEGGDEFLDEDEDQKDEEELSEMEAGKEEEGLVIFEKEEEKITQDDMKKRRMSVRRQSMFVRKKSIFYREEARNRDDITKERISGDFKGLKSDEFISQPLTSIDSFLFDSAELSTDEEEEDEEEKHVDREYYYRIYKETLPKHKFNKLKNNLLHSKMAEYFKRRHMDHVLKDTDDALESKQKYNKKLDALGELSNACTRQKNSISSILRSLRGQKEELLSMLNFNFNKMQHREEEIGKGLINTKTGKEISEKLVERLVRRQRNKCHEIAAMRLTYIKLRNKVAEKKEALRNLETVSANLHLMEFEQLKIEKAASIDKIEDRDGELENLRKKCRIALENLAHVREKVADITLTMIELNKRYDEVDLECLNARENLNYYKQQRNIYRFQTEKLKDKAGVLAKPKLCIDMNNSKTREGVLGEELEALKKENKKLKESIKGISHNLNVAALKAKNANQASIGASLSRSTKIYKGRPTLMIPTLPESNWSMAN